LILIDTSVLVQYIRTGSPAIRQVMVSANCGICGVVRAEILHGARSPKEVAAFLQAMNIFTQVPIHAATWDQQGLNLASLRARGLSMPFQDVLLSTIAIENDADLWSRDAHFRAIQGVLPRLKLFPGPVV
jgi:predicted nucleic acid-binding protein